MEAYYSHNGKGQTKFYVEDTTTKTVSRVKTAIRKGWTIETKGCGGD